MHIFVFWFVYADALQVLKTLIFVNSVEWLNNPVYPVPAYIVFVVFISTDALSIYNITSLDIHK